MGAPYLHELVFVAGDFLHAGTAPENFVGTSTSFRGLQALEHVLDRSFHIGVGIVDYRGVRKRLDVILTEEERKATHFRWYA